MSIRSRIDRLEQKGTNDFQVILPMELDASGLPSASSDDIAAMRFSQGERCLEVMREDEEDLRAFQLRARASAKREWPSALILQFGAGLI